MLPLFQFHAYKKMKVTIHSNIFCHKFMTCNLSVMTETAIQNSTRIANDEPCHSK